MANSNHAQAGQNIMMSSAVGLANVCGVAAAFIGGPQVHAYTVPYVQELTFETYGADMVGIATLAWYIISFLLVFYISRATIGTALVFGAVAIVTRFM